MKVTGSSVLSVVNAEKTSHLLPIGPSERWCGSFGRCHRVIGTALRHSCCDGFCGSSAVRASIQWFFRFNHWGAVQKSWLPFFPVGESVQRHSKGSESPASESPTGLYGKRSKDGHPEKSNDSNINHWASEPRINSVIAMEHLRLCGISAIGLVIL